MLASGATMETVAALSRVCIQQANPRRQGAPSQCIHVPDVVRVSLEPNGGWKSHIEES